MIDIIRQQNQKQQQQQQQQQDPNTASIRNHISVRVGKEMASAPVQKQQQQLQAESGQGEFDAAGTEFESGPTDVYENINDYIRQGQINRVFDDVLTVSDSSSKRSASEPADLLLQAENVRQQAIQRRSREGPPPPSDGSLPLNAAHAAAAAAAGVGLRPVPRQSATHATSSDPQEDQFKQFLAQKAANRRLSDVENGGSGGQESRGPVRPVPVSRSSVGPPKALSVDSATLPPAPKVAWKQRTRSMMSDQGGQQYNMQVSSQRAPGFSFPPPAAPTPADAAQMLESDFDLPPPPEEYCNLAEVTETAKPTASFFVGQTPKPNREVTTLSGSPFQISPFPSPAIAKITLILTITLSLTQIRTLNSTLT